jgi:hypothetical protein
MGAHAWLARDRLGTSSWQGLTIPIVRALGERK